MACQIPLRSGMTVGEPRWTIGLSLAGDRQRGDGQHRPRESGRDHHCHASCDGLHVLPLPLNFAL